MKQIVDSEKIIHYSKKEGKHKARFNGKCGVRMNLSQVECFLEIVKTGSFTKTAEKFFMTQQGVSRQIHSLEKYLGFPLFIRSKTGVKLTEEGQILYQDWNSGFYVLQTAIDKARDHFQGKEKKVKIALEDMGSATESIVASFSEFEKKEKALSIDFNILPPSKIRPLLDEGAIDFAIAFEEEFRDLTNIHKLSLNDRALHLVAAMGAAHPLATAPFDIQLFLKQPLGVLSTESSTHFRKIIDQIFHYYDVLPSGKFIEFQSRRELVVAVSTNRCVTIMYETSFHDKSEKLCIVPLYVAELSSKIGLYWKEEGNTIKARNLSSIIHDYLKEYN